MAVDSDKIVRTDERVKEKGLSLRGLVMGTLAVLVIGLVAGGWAMTRLLADRNTPLVTKVAAAPVEPGAPATSGEAAVPPEGVKEPPLVVAPVDGANALAARVGELETRLSRITLEAASASGNATRAEGLLIAFAARRALDRGLSLGYLEAQLRLRFGDDQPNAVKTIIDTARDPITLEQLRSELDALAPQLVGRNSESGGSLWTGIRRELGELFILRPAGTQSPRASQRIDRAHRYLAGGQADKAIEEVEAMPGAEVASEWLIDARRYHEARRALDLIETAAILEPRDSPPAAMPRTGATSR